MAAKDNESKKKIQLTALNLISQDGCESVTINQICKEANISKNTFYYYFASKDDLLLSFYELPDERISASIANIFAADNCIEQYWMTVAPLLDFITEGGSEIMKYMAHAHANYRKAEKEPPNPNHLNFSEIRTAIIKRGQSAGEMRNVFDPFSLQVIAQAQFFGLVSMWGTTDGKFNLAEAARLALELLLDVKPELRQADENALLNA